MSQPLRNHGGPSLAQLSLSGAAGVSRSALHSRSMMVALSHLIEDHAADSGATVLVATFQGLTHYRRQLRRYHRVAGRLGAVYVVGVPDAEVEPVPGVEVVPISADWPLAQEWVVLGSGPTFCGGLLARDAHGYRPEAFSRQFFGHWTTDSGVVDGAIAAFLHAIGRPTPDLRHDPRAVFERAQLMLKDLRGRLQR